MSLRILLWMRHWETVSQRQCRPLGCPNRTNRSRRTGSECDAWQKGGRGKSYLDR